MTSRDLSESDSRAGSIARLADDEPTAESAARAVLARLCARGGWAAARLELRNETERRPIWHVRRRQPIDLLRRAAEERRHAPTWLDEELRGPGWTEVPRPAGASWLFPLRAEDRLIGAVEVFARGEVSEDMLQRTLASCAEAAPVLARKPADVGLLASGLADPLTGLASRPLFMQRLAAAVERARQSASTALAVIVLNLDRFKMINGSLGHAAGDELLRGMARRLRQALGSRPLAARLAGDEFGILLERVHDPGAALRTAERVQRAVGEPFRLGDRELYVTAAVGVAFGGESCPRAEDLLRQADIAARRAKSEGVGRQAVFESSMHASAVAQLTLENELRGAIDREELEVHYQPIVSLADGDIVGFEALARWNHRELGSIPPVRFIPAAEEAGLIGRLGNFVLREACAGMRLLQMSARRPLSMSVNLSASQLFDVALVADVARILGSAGVDPSALRLEITESVLVEQPDAAAAVLERLRGLNLRICMDDFGTGYSSLSYLHRLPVDVLKIDRSFIVALESGDKPQGIVAAIVALAKNLRVELIAEGVETQQQAAVLQRLGVPQAQGYRFARALELQKAAALLRSYASSTRRTSPSSTNGLNGFWMSGAGADAPDSVPNG
ncbi:MAG TPA: bifunctional diguanylate cyclase/phosphodiesterase [Myxococcales bacterium]|nr:bifunctional diguanylate cyclase/phosphodiesterase [Myxococcales bacterium]